MIAAAALVVGMIIAFIIIDPVIAWITEPIRVLTEKRGANFAALNFTNVTSGFDLRMRIAFSIGIFLSSPIWLWQIWAFVMPGLTRKEIRYTALAYRRGADPRRSRCSSPAAGWGCSSSRT